MTDIAFNSNQFLRFIWHNQNNSHFFATNDRKHPCSFKNISVINDIDKQITELNNSEKDAYFACADYHNDTSRKADNTTGAWCLWIDADCSQKKAAAGQGYTDTDEAWTPVIRFCDTLELPKPNQVVFSGSGLHCYWTLDKFLPRDQWQDYAGKLKGLMQKYGLLADPSRTADIASVLRIPGTLNYKYSPPRPVALVHSNEQLIDTDSFLQQIDTALDLQVSGDTQDPVDANKYPAPAHPSNQHDVELDKLTSALTVLNPDCSDFEWKFHRIAALANTAQQYPDYADDLYQLACDWSSGKLAGKPSEKWVTPSRNTGKAGKDIIAELWNRFINDKGNGKRTSAGTIYYHARDAGWTYESSASASGQSDDIGFGD